MNLPLANSKDRTRPKRPMLCLVAAFAVGYAVATMIVMPADGTKSFAADTASLVSTDLTELTGDWPQWGGTSIRNNVPVGRGLPTEWDVGSFDRKSGKWNQDGSDNIKWVARVGSQTYGNPVVAGGRVFVGTNNGGRVPAALPGHRRPGMFDRVRSGIR